MSFSKDSENYWEEIDIKGRKRKLKIEKTVSCKIEFDLSTMMIMFYIDTTYTNPKNEQKKKKKQYQKIKETFIQFFF